MDVFTQFFGGKLPVKLENGLPLEEQRPPERAIVYPLKDGERPLQVQNGKLVPIGRYMPRERLI